MTSKRSGFEGESTDRFVREDVERRRAPRGLLPGLTARIAVGGGAPRPLDVLDVSRRSLFLATDDLASFSAGQVLDAEIGYKERRVQCKVRVARTETTPRRGLVVTMHEAGPRVEAALHELLQEAEVR